MTAKRRGVHVVARQDWDCVPSLPPEPWFVDDGTENRINRHQ